MTYSLATRDRSRASRPNVLYREGVELYRDRDLEKVLDRFEAGARFHVAESSPRRTFVHAAAVGWRDSAIVLPGSPGAGKTTLTIALVEAGATYLSDEFAPLDPRGRVHPFPKRLAIGQRSGRPPLQMSVEDLGGVQETRPLRVSLVVLTSHGARRWRPRRLTPGEGMLEVLAHTVSAQRWPREALSCLERIVSEAPVLRGRRGEAAETARLILRRLDSISGAS